MLSKAAVDSRGNCRPQGVPGPRGNQTPPDPKAVLPGSTGPQDPPHPTPWHLCFISSLALISLQRPLSFASSSVHTWPSSLLWSSHDFSVSPVESFTVPMCSSRKTDSSSLGQAGCPGRQGDESVLVC